MSGTPAEIRHLYIHVPFCRHKCGYCDFNAYAGMDRLMPDYVDALGRELAQARGELPFGPLETVYLGGGTPSLLPAELMSRLLELVRRTFDVAGGAEITVEANPGSTDAEKLDAWLAAGVNRLSLGVQGFDRRALAVLERRTDAAQAERAFELARRAGFQNINVDLIYAVPYQSLDSWVETLRRGVALRPEHISTYCLTFEEGTLLFRRRAAGKVPEVEPDVAWDQLDAASEELQAAGYIRYEVSNWAVPGKESRHNLAYWRCRPVYGAGAGAHSYLTDGVVAWRSWNVRRPKEYIADPRIEGREELDERKRHGEALMLGLRTAEGTRERPGFESEMKDLAAAGLIVREGGLARPTRRGMDLHNQIALAVL